jgi:alanine or glycine:cation symporter, AGCS family
MFRWIDSLSDIFLGWPLIGYVILASILCTLALRFVQIRYFMYAWRVVFAPQKRATKGDMTPFAAFINTLSANLGNGSIAGMATAIYSGGPGSAVWVVIIGFLLMAVRYAEVYTSVYFDVQTSPEKKGTLAGPMLYLKAVAGGTILAPLYSVCTLLFSLLVGNALQTNSISLSAYKTWNIAPITTAIVLTVFMLYVVLGGAQRVAKLSERIITLKVGIFFGSAFLVLGYNYVSIIPALKLMISSAFSPLAFSGGILGFSVQQAMRYGIARSIYATESGLGTAAILFSSTGSAEAVKNGSISMLSTFISTLVCFIVALCIVASGVWDSGLTSTALTIASYESTFGWLAGWVVSFLSISFGIGVLVAFVYITQEVWFSLTGGRFKHFFYVLFCIVSFFGALVTVETVFGMGDLIVGAMLLINLFGLVYLLPLMQTGLEKFEKRNK